MIEFAWTMLFAWPVLSIVFFSTMRLPVALCVTLLGGYLILPAQLAIDLPILPKLDKHTIPALTAMVLMTVMLGRKNAWAETLPGWVPRQPIAVICLGLLIVTSFGTALTNTDPLVFGPRHLPSLRTYDAFSIGLGFVMTVMPFILARKVLSSVEGQRLLLICAIAAAVLYAFPALFEVRMSPRLNKTIYGFFPHSWIQHIRGGGFRPLVFLDHGLWLGIFFTSAALGAFGLARGTKASSRKLLYIASGIWILFAISLSKVFGALLIFLTLLPVSLFIPKRGQALVVAAIATMVLLYPMMRAANLIPTDQVIAFADGFSSERSGSLQFRVDNEELLLARGQERPVFGWGGFQRNLIFDERGRNQSVTDGYWIIVFGQNGWLGYIGIFGLLTGGAIMLSVQRRDDLHPYSVALGIALVANLVDLVPNAGVSPLTWMMAGALLGRLEKRAERENIQDTPIAEKTHPKLRRDLTAAETSKKPEEVVYRRKFERKHR